MSPLTPLLILCVGAIGLLAGFWPRFRYAGLIAVTAAGGALLALLLLALDLPSSANLSAWAPASLFKVGLQLRADALAWLFVLALLFVTLATLVTGLARPGGRRLGTRAAILLIAAASLISIFSGNLLTRILAWALLDLVHFITLLTLRSDERLEPQAVLHLAFNSAGTLLALAAAVLISRTSETISLRDAALTAQSTLLITLAAVFRLGIFPLHLGMPAAIGLRQGLSTLLRLAPALVALETVSRLAAYGLPAGVIPWLTVFASAAALVGAIQLWSIPDPRQGIAYLVISQSGVALLAGLWGGAQAALALTSAVLSLVLGAALIYLGNGYNEGQRWPAVLPLVGVAAMAGAPLTIGFMGIGRLYVDLAQAGGGAWLALITLIVAQVILVAGLLYTVFWQQQPLEAVPLLTAVYYTGLSLPAVLLILLAFFTSVITTALGVPSLGLIGFAGPRSIIGLALTAVTLIGGYVVWRFDAPLRDRWGGLAGAITDSIGRLDWPYRFSWGLIRGLGAAVGGLAAVLEGEGAILWSLVAGILLWLLWRGSPIP